MQTIDAAIERIREYKSHMGWSNLRFANEAGISDRTLHDMDNPDWSPTVTILRKLESVIPQDFPEPKKNRVAAK